MLKNKKFLGFIKSMKFRLMLIFVVMAIVPCHILRIGIISSYEARAVSIRESEILSQSKILANKIAKSDFLAGKGDSDVDSQVNTLANLYDGRVILVDKSYKIVRDTYNIDERKTIISGQVVKTFAGKELINYDKKNHYVELTIPVSNIEDDNRNILGVMLVSVSTNNIVLNKVYLSQVGLIIEMTIGILFTFLGVLVALRLVRPMKKLETGIDAVSSGYTDTVEAVKTYTEIDLISEKLDLVLNKYKVIDDSRQEFVSNVSHELKTPLTSMKVLADSLIAMPDAPVGMYKEFMNDIASEIERENKIINDLLSLVKMDKSEGSLNITTLNINELLEQILKRLQPIADKQNVEVVLESFRPVTAEVDEVKITLAITNLVENAIKYNVRDDENEEGAEEQRWVHVSLNADHQYFFIKVEDNGIGIPEESLEHIYERFYRVDKSHSREIGGTGLGLAITRNSILMHRGAIKVHSVLNEGTTFDVRIPLNYIKA
ncbi:sensor histidine kinase [Lachnobacterium bovis]|uniref:histidine kinase n=1 Tax=Lachnobacterium bovis TaxID=140626 RepID=A0A1H9REX2_9FIRM|nr:HAMP domain-containing sensor histidine kinase [Lachnobacterium bovis]SER71204.1 Signal transduction histidine kinase [Lachnobacterium bovis]